MKALIIKIIKGYQAFISPSLGKNCRFLPSCSEYAVLSIKKHGVLKGVFFTAKRISKCHPWNPGGIDLP